MASPGFPTWKNNNATRVPGAPGATPAPTRISELERGTRLNIPLANAYREYLNTA